MACSFTRTSTPPPAAASGSSTLARHSPRRCRPATRYRWPRSARSATRSILDPFRIGVSMNRLDRDQIRMHVPAEAGALYDLVSDVTRTPEWSPAVVSCAWLDGAVSAAAGARFTARNPKGAGRRGSTSRLWRSPAVAASSPSSAQNGAAAQSAGPTGSSRPAPGRASSWDTRCCGQRRPGCTCSCGCCSASATCGPTCTPTWSPA